MTKAKFASLTAGLLARKGEAQPATPAHGFALLRDLSRGPEAAPQSGAGHNIFKEERMPPIRRDCVEALPRGETQARSLHVVAADHGAQAVHTVAVHMAQDNALVHKRRTAVTVRLDEARYLRLKLTGARLHRTNQDLLTAALDTYLAALGVEDIEAAPLPSKA
jgi:hypothetical protein